MRPPNKRHSVLQPLDLPFRLIPLTRGLNAICDTRDFDSLSRRNWYAKCVHSGLRETFYAATQGKNGEDILMHRLIVSCGPSIEIDHHDGDTLNNRRSNLRQSTKAQNGQNRGRQVNNRSGYKGVDWQKSHRKWRSRIVANGIRRNLGRFESKEAAARAYDAAALELHGEFARTNFQQEVACHN